MYPSGHDLTVCRQRLDVARQPDTEDQPSANYVTCRCQHCDKGIEFDASGFAKGETQIVNCPHCALETVLFVPPPVSETHIQQPAPPIIGIPKKKNRRTIGGILAIAFACVLLGGLGIFVFPLLIPKTWEKTDTFQSGDVSVKVERMYNSADFIPNGIGSGVTPTADLFHVRMRISNLSKTQKIDFTTWRSRGFGFSSRQATLSDNFGNYFKAITFDPTPTYLQDENTIYPGQDISDILVFQQPVSNLKWFHLELPASNFGQSGTIRFEIPPNIYGTPLF